MNKIAHLSDIHIRNTQYHDEYRVVFDNLYKSLRKSQPDLIYIAGDLFHSKQVLSPESVKLASEFLSNLAEVAPVLIILGNHDVSLSAKEQRLDAISPIVQLLNNPRITYLKESCVHPLSDNTYAVHFSCVDDIVPDESVIPEDATKIILFHGVVSGAKTHIGKSFDHTDDAGRNIDWEKYDIGMLGDIHMAQKVAGNCYYASSLICQDFGEHPSNHGYILWDVPTKSSSYVKVKNPYTYYTFYYNNGAIDNEKLAREIPTTSKVRIFYDPSEKLADVKAGVRVFMPNVASIIYRKNNTGASGDVENIATKQDIVDLYNLETVNSLLTEYIGESIPEQKRNALLDLNKRIYAENVEKFESRGKRVNYKLKDIKFSNTFAYGEDNIVNFRNLNGVIGLSAPNRTGKSSFLNTIPFAIQGTFPRMGKVDNVFNNNENTYSTQVTLETGNSIFSIERSGKRTKKTSSNSLTFKEYIDGHEINHTEDANITKSKIKDIFGDLDTYLRSAYIYQNSNDLFLNLTPMQRIDWISKNLGTEIFDILNKYAKEESKELKGKVSVYESRDFVAEELEQLDIINKSKDQIDILKELNNTIQQKIDTLRSEIVQISSTKLPEPTQEDLSTNQKNYNDLRILNATIENIQGHIKDLKRDIQNSSVGFTSTDIYKSIIKKIELANSELESIKSDESHLKAVDKLNQEIEHTKSLGLAEKAKFEVASTDVDNKKITIEELRNSLGEEVEQYLNDNRFRLKPLEVKQNSIENDIFMKNAEVSKLKKSVSILSEDERYTNEKLCKSCPLLKNAFLDNSKLETLEKEIEQLNSELSIYKSKIDEEEKRVGIAITLIKEMDTLNLLQERLLTATEKRNNLLQRYKTQVKELETLQTNYESQKQIHLNHVNEKLKTLNESLVSEEGKYLQGLQSELELNIEKLSSNNTKVELLMVSIEAFKKLSENMDKNKDKYVAIQALEQEIESLSDGQFKTNLDSISMLERKVSIAEYQIETILKDKETLQELYTKYEVYDQYIRVTSKSELPLFVIRKCLNVMESNINDVLSKVTDFVIELSIEGDNIEAKAYSASRGHWTTDLLSGMESFVVNLAFRIGMLEIANIPVPNFLVVDEGFSALDADNAQKIPDLFEYLKSIYDFVIVVSHNDYMNDFVDSQLVINRTNEKSQLYYP
jgi:DNA repair exonuclease SbcCD ATPase subunit